MRFNFAIIGGGLTATAMLCQFANKVQKKLAEGQLNPAGLCIQIYEKQAVFGPGFPHSDRYVLPFHITNMCAADMGILEGRPEDFQNWVIDNSEKLEARFGFAAVAAAEQTASQPLCRHYPRAIMGEYLKARFQEALLAAQQAGLAVTLYSASEVVDLCRKGDRLTLRIKNLASGKYFTRDADRVLLATGHWFEKNDQSRYFPSPWPAKRLLDGIPPNAKIAVLGTSLSAIETLLTLTSEGWFVRSDSGELSYIPPAVSRKFVLYSRRGLLPKVRGKMGRHKNRFLNRKNLDRLLSENRGNLKLKPVFDLLNSELEAAYGRPIDWIEIINPTGKPQDLLQGYIKDAVTGDGADGELIWQTILHQCFDMVRDVYLNLALAERKRFDDNYTSVFFTHAATQPVINAEKLLALMKAGLVEVVKLGKNYQLIKDEANGYYEFVYRDDRGNFKKDAYRYLVNARGQEKSIKTDPSALTNNLINSGTALIEEFRSVDRPSPGGDHVCPGPEIAGETYKTGSIWIDPDTHLIIQAGSADKPAPSRTIYAVGAMTRGQIIDASMARGIVRATSRIAADIIDHLIQKASYSA